MVIQTIRIKYSLFLIAGCLSFLLNACTPKESPEITTNTPRSLLTGAQFGVLNPTYFAAMQYGDVHIVVASDGVILKSTTNSAGWYRAKTDGIVDNFLAVASSADGHQFMAVGEQGLIAVSQDAGETWQRLKTAHTQDLLSVGYDADHQRWIAAGNGNQLLQINAKDLHWEQRTLEFAGNVTALAVLPNQQALILAGTNSLLMSSHDGGTNWQQLITATDVAFNKLLVLPNNIILAIASDGKIYRSQNDLQQWELIDTGTRAYLSGITYDPEHKTLILLSSDGEVLISDDFGLLWAPVYKANDYLNQATYSPENHNIMIAGNQGVLLHATDGGRIWTRVPSPLKADIELLVQTHQQLYGFGPNGLIISSSQPDVAWQVVQHPIADFIHAIGIDTQQHKTIVGARGLLMTADQKGENWQPLNAAVTEEDYFFSLIHDKKFNTQITAGPPGIILQTTDAEKNWQVRLALSNSAEGYFHQLIGNQRGTLVALAGPGYSQYSLDGGTQWARCNIATDKQLFNGLYDNSRQKFYAIGQHGRILQSSDGVDWQTLMSGTLNNLQAIAATAKHLIVGGSKGTLLVSSNSGATWQAPSLDTSEGILHLNTTSDPKILIATGTNGLLLRSIDEGLHWAVITNPARGNLRALVEDTHSNILYVPSRRGEIIYSDDKGVSWALLPSVTKRSIKALMVDQETKSLFGIGERLIKTPLIEIH